MLPICKIILSIICPILRHFSRKMVAWDMACPNPDQAADIQAEEFDNLVESLIDGGCKSGRSCLHMLRQ